MLSESQKPSIWVDFNKREDQMFILKIVCLISKLKPEKQAWIALGEWFAAKIFLAIRITVHLTIWTRAQSGRRWMKAETFKVV